MYRIKMSLFVCGLFLFGMTLEVAGQEKAGTEEESASEKAAIDETRLSDEEKEVVALVRKFRELGRAVKYGEAVPLFGGELRRMVTPEFLKHVLDMVAEQKGSWKSEKITEVTKQGDNFVIQLVAEYENGDLEITFASNATPEIIALSFVLDPPPELATMATEFVELNEKEEYEEAVNMFDDVMKGLIPPESLKQGAENLKTALGELEDYGEMHYMPGPGVDVILVYLKYERARMVLQLAFNEQKQIAGWYVGPADAAARAALLEGQSSNQQESAEEEP